MHTKELLGIMHELDTISIYFYVLVNISTSRIFMCLLFNQIKPKKFVVYHGFNITFNTNLQECMNLGFNNN
jgi:hypothetical protein